MLRRFLPCLGLLALSACVAPPQGGYAPAMAGQRSCDTSFDVVNASSYTVQELYFSPAAMRAWGNDQLGQNVLPPGRRASFRAANPGAHDFRVVWNNGRSAELRGIDVCVASTVTATNTGLLAN